MRASIIAAAVLAAGCAHVAPLRPAQSDQAAPGDPQSAAAELAGVRLTVRPDDWRGWPDDLDQYVTPVEVLVENKSGKELDLAPRLFSLIGPDGRRYATLGPGDVRRHLRAYRRWYGGPYYPGWFGVYPWPGFYRPWLEPYPYYWWDPWPAGPPAQPVPRPSSATSLLDGGHASVLLFFAVPADELPSLTVEARLVAVGGEQLGEVRLPFVRAR
ncbi:MAG TPA: hypothetical protein VFP50_11040 [Anaeromyxobacteraceae bacterium]|nr:hypothetical protein [Anaeromyxobacteraceae bacterium]